MSILHDKTLKNLKCSACSKYLSVLPIKVYPDGSIKCGRCSEANDDGVRSLCNNIFKNCLFKCVNRYEGCNKILPTSGIVEHEGVCTSKTFNCPKCDYKFSGSAYELLSHYTKQHPKVILRNGTFSLKITQDFKEIYLYLIKDKIFFILIENLVKEKVLYLSTTSLLPYKNVRQWFSVAPVRTPTKHTFTNTSPCCSLEDFKCDSYFSVPTNSMNGKVNCRAYLDLSQAVNVVDQVLIPTRKQQQPKCTASIYTQTAEEEIVPKVVPSASRSIQTVALEDIFGVKLTDEFTKEYPDYKLTPCGTALLSSKDRVELTCSNCKHLTGCNVFNCQLNKHIVCWDCKAWCGICNTSINGWDSRISNLNELLLLPCKWQCGTFNSGNQLRVHELKCEKPKWDKCFACSLHIWLDHRPRRGAPIVETNSFQQLIDHLIVRHKNYNNVVEFNMARYLEDCLRYEGATGEVYFFQNGYWFKMRAMKRFNGYEIRVKSLDDVGPYELAIVCDSGNRYNKICNDSMSISLSDNPKFYLKRTRNL